MPSKLKSKPRPASARAWQRMLSGRRLDLLDPSPLDVELAANAYRAVEARLQAAIHLRFGLPVMLGDDVLALIKSADRAAAYLEATRLAGFSTAEAGRFFGQPPKFSAVIERDYLTPWPADVA